MSSICVLCNKDVTRERFPGVKCAKCGYATHNKCGAISNELYEGIQNGSATWLCSKCRSNTSRKSVIDEDLAVNIPELSNNPNLAEIATILKYVHHKLKILDDLEKSLSSLCTDFDDIKSLLKNLSNDNVQINLKLKKLEDKHYQQEQKINTLEALMDITHQKEINNNVVICDLPVDVPDVSSLILNTIQKVKDDVVPTDIIGIKKKYHNPNSKSLLRNSFIVTLISSNLKDEVLTKVQIVQENIHIATN